MTTCGIKLLALSESIKELAEKAQALALELLNDEEGVPTTFSWLDIRGDLPYNSNPDHPEWVYTKGRKDWWVRDTSVIDGITIHHSAGQTTPQLVADYITRPIRNRGKGLPRTQYHFWVTNDGVIYYCLDLTYGPWHDSCGDKNTHVSIVLDGALNVSKPSRSQLVSTGLLVNWLMDTFDIPLKNVEGHRDWAYRFIKQYTTVCPGWDQAKWREEFFEILTQAAVLTSLGRSKSFAQMTFGAKGITFPGSDLDIELSSMSRGSTDESEEAKKIGGV